MWKPFYSWAWLLVAATAAGCGGETTASDEALNIQMQGQTLVLKVDPQAHLRYETCDLFQGVEEQRGNQWVPVRDDRPITYYQPSTFDGYMLDGKFVPPSTFAGCDLNECDDLPKDADVGDATEYIADGTTTPPASYDYEDPFVRPPTISVYESRALHGVKLRTHVKYFTDMACTSPRNVTLEVEVP